MGANKFLTVATLNPGNEGAQPAIDLWSLVPTSGINGDLTFFCSGNFTGDIAIEGSPSATGNNWSVITQFNAGLDAVGGSGPLLFSAQNAYNTVVRRLRALVKGRIVSETIITVAGQQNCLAIPSQASWPLDTVRYFLVDYVNGNDSNVGYIDAAAGTEFDPAELQLLAVKTIEEIQRRIPRQGAGRLAVILIRGDATASAPIEYFRKDGTTRDWIDRSGYSGYPCLLWRPSDFTNTLADRRFCAAYNAFPGPGDDGVWTVSSYTAPIVTVASGTLPAFGQSEGCFVDWTGNITPTLAQRAGQVKRVRSDDTVEVSIGTLANPNPPQADDTFKITRPSVLIACDIGGDTNQSTDRATNTFSNISSGTSIVGFQYGGWSPAITGGLGYKNRVNGVRFARTYWTGFFSARFSSGFGFKFNGTYEDETKQTIDCGCSAGFRSPIGLMTVHFTGPSLAEVGTAIPAISNLVVYAPDSGSLLLNSAISAYGATAILSSSAIYGTLYVTGMQLPWIGQTAPGLGDSGIGGISAETRLIIRPSLAAITSHLPAIWIGGNANFLLDHVLIGNSPTDAIIFAGCYARVLARNVQQDTETNAGYGVDFMHDAINAFNQLVVADGNTVTGALGDILFDTGIVKTWANISQGFISSNASQILRLGQSINFLKKLTLDTLANAPVLSANPASPINGDVWIFESGGTRQVRVQLGGSTYAADLVLVV